MLARVYSCATVGLEGQLVEVVVDVGPGPVHALRVAARLQQT